MHSLVLNKIGWHLQIAFVFISSPWMWSKTTHACMLHPQMQMQSKATHACLLTIDTSFSLRNANASSYVRMHPTWNHTYWRYLQEMQDNMACKCSN